MGGARALTLSTDGVTTATDRHQRGVSVARIRQAAPFLGRFYHSLFYRHVECGHLFYAAFPSYSH